MLIRSQDKEQLLNIDSVKTIGICERGKCFAIFIDSLYFIGNYSSREKVIKVLDMIQEAYADFETSKITNTGLATAAYTGSYKTPDSVSVGIKVLKGYAEMAKESVVFQMPEDSEVVV
jgi:hypothetical protein